MTGKADVTEGDWRIVLEGPPTAGMIVVTAQRGGTLRETLAIAKHRFEARKSHGESEVLDEIVSAKPEIDRTRYHSAEELKEHGLQHLRDAVELLGREFGTHTCGCGDAARDAAAPRVCCLSAPRAGSSTTAAARSTPR